jgi:hypothetical protein
MVYRIVIKTTFGGKIYYLSSDDDCPETDAPVNLETIQFLSKLNPTHAHSFSTEEKANEVINSLPYPYCEKALVISANSASSPVVSTVFYRVIKKDYNSDKILWANLDKSFTEDITNNTVFFNTEIEAEEFINSLVGLKKRYSFIAKIKDYGEPEFKFDVEFVVNGRTVFNQSEIPGITKI